MAIECSLEILIKNADASIIASLAAQLPNKYIGSVSSKTGNLSISVDDFEFSDWLAFDAFSHDFIEGLKYLGKHMALGGSIFRVGIYYNLSETSIFPFRLSNPLIKVISDMGLSLDVSGYPCSDED